MTDIVERLRELHVQATRERSHYYVGSCVSEAADLIESLRRENAWLPIESAPRQGRILVYNGFFGVYTTEFIDGEWPIFLSDGMKGNWFPVPSHWRPLPSPPSQESGT